jgi:ribosomal protein L20
MMIEIHKINKRRKKWLNLKKGYWNRNNLFFES